ncbi:hypothetical protein TNCV_2591211 [Trichonephila clavipes]|nr:hypothetical protein TNCV_2591211 [Trichonephila clavipes]
MYCYEANIVTNPVQPHLWNPPTNDNVGIMVSDASVFGSKSTLTLIQKTRLNKRYVDKCPAAGNIPLFLELFRFLLKQELAKAFIRISPVSTCQRVLQDVQMLL